MSTKNNENAIHPQLQCYFLNFFESNWNNVNNTWKGTKSLITLKQISATFPRTLNQNNSTVTNPGEIANIFNNHFASAAEKTRAPVNYSHKHFSEYMENKSFRSFYLSPTNKNEISSIISSLNPNNCIGQNSIPKKILKLLRMKFHFIFLTSVTTLFLWIYSHQSFLYIKRTVSLTAVISIQYFFNQILKK